jgi:hypothetical protein
MSTSKLVDRIEQGEGTFSETKQYAFNNWYIPNGKTEGVDFTFKWDGKTFIVKAGEIAVYPEYLAAHAAKHYVTWIMLQEGKDVMFLNSEARDEYEAKTIKEIEAGGEDPYVASIREQERAKLLNQYGFQGVDAGITSSETRREAYERADKAATKVVQNDNLAKARAAKAAKKEFAQANT